jgi:hypothetical protein
MVSGGIVSGCSMRTHSAASKYEWIIIICQQY